MKRLLEFKHFNVRLNISEEYFNIIAEEFGEKIIESIGKGVNGVAFKLESGKVLKITSDKSEALIANKLRTKPITKYLINYYDVRKIIFPNEWLKYNYNNESDNRYAIIMDYVIPFQEYIKSIGLNTSIYTTICSRINEYIYEQKKPKYFLDFYNYLIIKSRKFHDISMIDFLKKPYLESKKDKKLLNRIFRNLIKILDEAKKYDIRIIDFKMENLGYNLDTNNLVIFDLTDYKTKITNTIKILKIL